MSETIISRTKEGVFEFLEEDVVGVRQTESETSEGFTVDYLVYLDWQRGDYGGLYVSESAYMQARDALRSDARSW